MEGKVRSSQSPQGDAFTRGKENPWPTATKPKDPAEVIRDLQSRNRELARDCNSLRDRLENVRSERDTAKGRLQVEDRDRFETQTEIRTLKQDVERLKAEADELRSKLTIVSQQRDANAGACYEAEAKVRALTQQIESLKELLYEEKLNNARNEAKATALDNLKGQFLGLIETLHVRTLGSFQ